MTNFINGPAGPWPWTPCFFNLEDPEYNFESPLKYFCTLSLFKIMSADNIMATFLQNARNSMQMSLSEATVLPNRMLSTNHRTIQFFWIYFKRPQ